MRRPTLILLSTLALAGCSSPGSKKPEKPPVLNRPSLPDPMGKFLGDLDLRIRSWSHLAMTARDPGEGRQARSLYEIIQRDSLKRIEELILELETGPPRNRQRAAAALGFTADPRALAPLLGALEDPDIDVVHNALLGLALLRDPQTPLAPIVALMADHADGPTRSNAAYALRCVVEAGGAPEPFLPAMRMALHDSEGGVRVQAALVVGLAADGESAQRLADLLYDDEPLVRLAAIEGLVLLGRRTDAGAVKGAAARALVDAWREGDRKIRPHLLEGMVQLAGENHGADEERWYEWSRNLPR